MASFWILVDRLALPIVLFAILAPFVGLGLGAVLGSRRQSASGTYRTGSWALRGLGLGAVITLPLLYLGMCTPPPGQGARAAEGFQRAVSVLSALDNYRSRLGTYPDSLRQLVPELLPDSMLGEGRFVYPFEYRRTATGFALSFRYVRPGMNQCHLDSDARQWSCSGYY